MVEVMTSLCAGLFVGKGKFERIRDKLQPERRNFKQSKCFEN